MVNDERPDYFAAAPSMEDAVLRGIKGNFRRQMVIKSLLSEGGLRAKCDVFLQTRRPVCGWLLAA